MRKLVRLATLSALSSSEAAIGEPTSTMRSAAGVNSGVAASADAASADAASVSASPDAGEVGKSEIAAASAGAALSDAAGAPLRR